MEQHSPLRLAQSLDAQAEEYEAKGALREALTARSRAASYFDSAAKSTQDANARKTLNLLANKQRSLVADLEARLKKKKLQSPPPQAAAAAEGSSNINARYLQRSNAAAIGPSHNTHLSNGLSHNKISQSPSYPSAGVSGLSRSNATSSVHHDIGQSMYSTSGNTMASIYPEGSYMLLRDDTNSLDPFVKFNLAVEGMLDQLSAPVAFATVPLQSPVLRKSIPQFAVKRPLDKEESKRGVGPEDSFIFVPLQADTPENEPAFLPKSKTSTPVPSIPSQSVLPASSPPPSRSVNTKTAEELSLENESLKEALDELATQYHNMVSESNKQRSKLKESVMGLKKDFNAFNSFGSVVGAQSPTGPAGRVKGMTSSSSRGKEPQTVAEEISDDSMPGFSEDSSNDVERLRLELALAKKEAAKYKSRYENLKDAIKKKREATAAKAASSTTSAAALGAQASPAISSRQSTS